MMVGAVWPFAWPDMRFSVQVHGATQCLGAHNGLLPVEAGLQDKLWDCGTDFRLCLNAATAAAVLLAGAGAVHRRLVAYHRWSTVHAAEPSV